MGITRMHGALRHVGALCAIAAAVAFASNVDAKGTTTNAPLETLTDIQTITSAGPLDAIYLGVDASAQIAHTGDASGEVYPSGATPADYGTFVVVDNVLYAPDFANHSGTATGNGLGAYTPFTPISQSGVTGAGTAASPFTVTTQVQVGTTGLVITQTDSYVVGQESYRTDVFIANGGGAAVSAIVYRAMDCYLGGSDSGYGLVTGTAVACTVNPNNVPAGLIEQLVPLTGGSSYYQDFYGSVWAAIGAHTPFGNTCACDSSLDNGEGLSWSVTVPPGGSTTISNLTVFSSTGAQALPVTKTADQASVAAGAADGYTITVSNPNATAASLNSIIDTLPAGFAYTLGSTSGATTANPTISGNTLTWAGPIAVAPGGSVSLHFGVTVSSVAGTYTNTATADAGADTVAGTGPTAPVTVGGGGPPPPPSNAAPLPTLGGEMIAALIALMLAAGVYAGRRARG
jgi:uncharacterized repeat protein (TIGR01451 family)